jgi:transposase InsO family protein
MNSFDANYMNLKENKLKSIINKEKTVVEVAKELEVSRQSVHKWLSRYKRFGVEGLTTVQKKRFCIAHNRTSDVIEQLVINLADTYYADGVETLHDRLQYENNVTLNPVTIYRILKRNNRRYTSNYTQTQKQWKKKLFSHQMPGLELQMDTTYPFGYKQGRVIYTAIDDASRWVFAWSYETANAINTIDFVKRLQARTPFVIQKIRTDCGKEFIARTVEEYLSTQSILHRRNTPYCPEENGKIERFHRTFNEKALRFGFHSEDTLDTTQYKLNLFLGYYNYEKRHRGLGMDGKTPMEWLREHKSVNLTVQCYKS